MFNFFKLLKGPFIKGESCLGIDIGTTSIKITELVQGTDKPVLRNYGILESHGHLERLNDVIQTSSLKIVNEEAVSLLKLLMREFRPKSRTAIVSLPSFSAFTALLDIPLMNREETARAMTYQVKAVIPLPLTEVAIDWLPVGEYEDEVGTKKQHIFLVSVPHEQIKKYQAIFEAAGLTLKVLEIETMSLARILTHGDPTTSLIVDIGARSTAIAVGSNGLLKYSSQTDFSGSSLTQAIAKGLGVNVRRAEELKRQRGLIGAGGEYEVSTLMLPYLDVILSEVRRVKDIYEKSYRAKIERVILSGGGANLIGIDKYVTKQFNLPTVKANPLSRINSPSSITPLVGELGPPLAVSLGLGIKGVLQ